MSNYNIFFVIVTVSVAEYAVLHIQRFIHNLLCSDELCVSNNVQCTLYTIVLQNYVCTICVVPVLATVESNLTSMRGASFKTN